jgi:hypothetical protein
MPVTSMYFCSGFSPAAAGLAGAATITADVVCERPKNQYIANTIRIIITPEATPNSHFGVPCGCGTAYCEGSGAGV